MTKKPFIQNFQYESLNNRSPIYTFKLPKEICKELDSWEMACKKIKNHPLSELKSHENIGYDPDDVFGSGNETTFNTYQCGIPPELIENSFWLGYTLRFCSFLYGGNHRNYFMRKWDGHFDGYDIWTNFSYKGNENPIHDHPGAISGVIYHKNHKHPIFFPEYNSEYEGTNGTMILFPSKVFHNVEIQKSDKERITFAFNINTRDI